MRVDETVASVATKNAALTPRNQPAKTPQAPKAAPVSNKVKTGAPKQDITINPEIAKAFHPICARADSKDG